MDKAINIQDLLIGYGSGSNSCAILAPISATVSKGELICLIGENGKGKSTLIKTISNNLKPISGKISILSKDISKYNSRELASCISLVLADRISIGMISVYDLVAFGRYPFTNWLAKINQRDQQIINESLEDCGITHLSQRFFSNLSDGEKQKVLIARAIAQQTPIIILDEPLNHLDLINKAEIFSLLKRLCTDKGKAIILSTHQIDLALQASDKIWLINHQNQLIETTAKKAVKDRLFENSFVSDKVKFDAATLTFKLKTN